MFSVTSRTRIRIWTKIKSDRRIGPKNTTDRRICIPLFTPLFKEESTRKLSNFDFQWTKTLYQNNLKNIAFFFTFFKGLRCNKSSVVTPKKISHGSPRKWMSNFTRIVITQVKFWKFHEWDVILWNLTFRILGLPWEMFFWCYYRWFITSRDVPAFKQISTRLQVIRTVW